MPLTVAIVCGVIEKGIMKCGINWARNIQTDADRESKT
jgi:hypothetical protein